MTQYQQRQTTIPPMNNIGIIRGFLCLDAEPNRACLGWRVPIDRC